jgi:hypothetical protein
MYNVQANEIIKSRAAAQQSHPIVGEANPREGCNVAVDWLKNGPVNIPRAISKGQWWSDSEFRGTSALYWENFAEKEYKDDITFGEGEGWYFWRRYRVQYKTFSLWDKSGNDPDPTDIKQGGAASGYILAAAAAVAEFPETIRALFVTPDENKVGILALKFYIRGKPWVVDIDDNFYFYRP